MKIGSVLAVAVALTAGFAAGYVVRGPSSAPAESAPAPRRSASIAEVTPAVAVRNAAFESEVFVTNTVVVTNGFPFADGRRHDPREWMENLKNADPKRYAETTNRIARWRQRRLENANSKLEFFSSIDTSGWSARSRETHERLQELIAKRELVEQALHDPDVGEEERGRLFQELRSSGHALRGLNAQERNTLFYEAARALGVGDAEAKEFTAAAREIVEATDNGFGGRFPPPPPK